jgi:hypothetical protein
MARRHQLEDLEHTFILDPGSGTLDDPTYLGSKTARVREIRNSITHWEAPSTP